MMVLLYHYQWLTRKKGLRVGSYILKGVFYNPFDIIYVIGYKIIVLIKNHKTPSMKKIAIFYLIT